MLDIASYSRDLPLAESLWSIVSNSSGDLVLARPTDRPPQENTYDSYLEALHKCDALDRIIPLLIKWRDSSWHLTPTPSIVTAAARFLETAQTDAKPALQQAFPQIWPEVLQRLETKQPKDRTYT